MLYLMCYVAGFLSCAGLVFALSWLAEAQAAGAVRLKDDNND